MSKKVMLEENIGTVFYVPERVFFYNLYRCCQCSHNKLLSKINDAMIYEINEQLSYLDVLIDNLTCTEDTVIKDCSHILPSSLIDFVKKTCNSKQSRSQNYFLTTCLDLIRDATQDARRYKNKKYRKSIIQEDKDTIAQFREMISDPNATALSKRELDRLLHSTGYSATGNIADIKTYTPNQDCIVKFIISKVFPTIITSPRKPFIASIANDGWQDIIYCCSELTHYNLHVVSIDSSAKDKFECIMKSSFQNLQKNESDYSALELYYEEHGNELLNIYEIICAYNKHNKIRGLKYNQSTSLDSEEKEPPVCDDATLEYDAVISTHIVNYINLLNLVHKNGPDYMDCITRIIEKVRTPVVTKVNMSELLNCQRKDFQSDSLFLWDGNENLLQHLIAAINEEQDVFFSTIETGGQYE